MSRGQQHERREVRGVSDVLVRLASLVEIRALQLAVLRPDGPLPGDVAPPADALHVGAFDDVGAAIGAATIAPASWPGPGALEPPTWQLRSMAVRPDLQGRGIGRSVLALAVATARERGAVTLWAQARVGALDFYLGAEWTAVGPVWDKPGVGPHRYVTLRLAPAPA